jgi:hypothetical protein
MADLNGFGLKSMKMIRVPGDTHEVGVWELVLSGEASDTFTVPALTSTSAVAIMLMGAREDPLLGNNAQASITVSAAAADEGNTTVTVTNSASPRRRNRVIVTTMHRKGRSNNHSIDEDPT